MTRLEVWLADPRGPWLSRPSLKRTSGSAGKDLALQLDTGLADVDVEPLAKKRYGASRGQVPDPAPLVPIPVAVAPATWRQNYLGVGI